jgi:hypothetical protein
MSLAATSLVFKTTRLKQEYISNISNKQIVHFYSCQIRFPATWLCPPGLGGIDLEYLELVPLGLGGPLNVLQEFHLKSSLSLCSRHFN